MEATMSPTGLLRPRLRTACRHATLSVPAGREWTGLYGGSGCTCCVSHGVGLVLECTQKASRLCHLSDGQTNEFLLA